MSLLRIDAINFWCRSEKGKDPGIFSHFLAMLKKIPVSVPLSDPHQKLMASILSRETSLSKLDKSTNNAWILMKTIRHI